MKAISKITKPDILVFCRNFFLQLLCPSVGGAHRYPAFFLLF